MVMVRVKRKVYDLECIIIMYMFVICAFDLSESKRKH